MAMRVFQWCRTAAVAAFLVCAAPAMAQNCVGFTDVLQSDAFCPNVEWLKNRGITLGCNPPTNNNYCPTANVSRLAMAAFLNRVGTALTPVELGTVANDSMVPLNLNAPGQVRCQTGVYTVLNYPRRAVFNNKANLFEATARVDVLAEAVYSTDSGVTWTAVVDSQTFQTLNSGGSPPDDVSTYQLGYLDLNVGQAYIFGVRVLRAPGTAGTGNARVYCVNRVQIQNRNGASSPFDDAYMPPVEDRTGRAAIPPGN
jgi:hypothetical protein